MGRKGLWLRAVGAAVALVMALPVVGSARSEGGPRPDGPQAPEPELIEFDQPVASPAWQRTVDSKKIADRRNRGFGQTEVLSGTARLPVALVDFSDNVAERIHPPKSYEDMLFQRNHPNGSGSLRDYYLDQSGGLFDVEGQVSQTWERAPLRYSTYAGSENGLQSAEPNAHTLVRDTAQAVDDEFDFCDFDFDGNGYVDTFFVVHAGAGAEETSAGGPGSGIGIWSHLSYLSPNFVTNDICTDGRRARIGYYAMQPEEHASANLTAPGAPDRLISIGVFAHEFGHALGLPDLYDIDYDTHGGVGSWDLMGSGAWGFEGHRPWRPVPLGAWTKARLGWALPQQVTDDVMAQEFVSADRPRDGSFTGIYKLSPNGDPASLEYFLVEYRDESSPFSVGMPEGLAVWHVNEARLGDDNLDNADQNDRLLELVQADGLDELGGSTGSEYGDAGDIFPGSTNRTYLDSEGEPNTRLRTGEISRVALRNITVGEGTASADLFVNDMLIAPEPPTDLAAERFGRDVRLSWVPSFAAGVTQQRIYRSTSPDGAPQRIGVVSATETSYLDVAAPEGTTSYYTVRAYNGTESEPSQQVAITLPLGPLAPTGLEVFHGALSGSIRSLSTKGDRGVEIASRFYKGAQTVDYDLIYLLSDTSIREFVLELIPKRRLKTKLFIGNWSSGEYDTVGSFDIRAGRQKRIRFSNAAPYISGEGYIRIGLSHRRNRAFAHILDRTLLRFP
ncbi:MAG: M6 family metalloprotease domain-containing protein [Actinomycetota bacterium]